jgi:hypothetical protein
MRGDILAFASVRFTNTDWHGKASITVASKTAPMFAHFVMIRLF